ncbi:hypothetical protein EYC84_009029 [Monilinia fructicola]|uniref:Uncharacterized protein n=1 Tax=Monilinia fructicola TaxID=38448 RepID=A0A5M9JFI2_MONFR|nr:hypothetical protein EYC84_009029 [Monilinia fructicola]
MKPITSFNGSRLRGEASRGLWTVSRDKIGKEREGKKRPLEKGTYIQEERVPYYNKRGWTVCVNSGFNWGNFFAPSLHLI